MNQLIFDYTPYCTRVALVENGRGTVRNVTSGKSFGVRAEFTERQKNILKAGGTVNLYKNAK